MAALQSIRNNMLALQRQWAVIAGQPDGPQKAAAQQHLANQMKRLQIMEQSTLMAMNGAAQPQQQPQQPMMPNQQGFQQPPDPSPQQQFGQNNLQQQQQSQQQQGIMQGQPGSSGTGQDQSQASSGGQAIKRDFVGTVRNFMAQRGTPWPANQSLTFVGPASSNVPAEMRSVELQSLFAAVVNGGGSQRASQIPGFWAVIASRMGLKVGPPDGTQSSPDALPPPGEVPDRLAHFYRDRLGAFEQFWFSRMPQRQNSAQTTGSAGSPAPAMQNNIDPQLQQQPQAQQQGQQFGTPGSSAASPAPSQFLGNNGQQPNPQQQQQPPKQGTPTMPNAGNIPANMHQQMAQLQQLVSTGRITPQQARERFVAMQQAMRNVMIKQQQAQQQQQPQQQMQGLLLGAQPEQQQQSQTAPGQFGMSPQMQGQMGGMPGFPGQNQAQQFGQQQFPGQQPMAPPPVPPSGQNMMQCGSSDQQLMASVPSSDGSQVPQWPAQPNQNKANGSPMPKPLAPPTPGGSKDPKREKKKRKKNDPDTPGTAPITPVTPKPEPQSQPQRQSSAQPTSVKQGTPASRPATPLPPPSNKFKIEYLPLRRDVHTHGGWDLNLIETQLAPLAATRGRPRTVRELGTVDVHALIMSIRSRMQIEISYAINALFILSAGVGAPPTFQFPLAPCEELLDEILDLLEESAFDTEEEPSSAESKALPTYMDWLRAATEETAELKIWTRRKAGRSHSMDDSISTFGVEAERERRIEHQAATALSLLSIIKNFATMPENAFYMNRFPRVLDFLAKICRFDACLEGGDGTPTVFTTLEAFRVRKDVLAILSSLAGDSLSLRHRPKETVETIFELVTCFIIDAGLIEELEHAGDSADMASRAVVRKIPYYADMALDALSRLALPDDNRQVLGTLIPSERLLSLFTELIHLLPISESDFQLLKTEPRLGYTERLAMCLYNLAFLAPPTVKIQLRRIPGLGGIVFRIVKRLSKAVPDFNRNPFSVLCRRLVEALRLVSEGQDMFGAPPLLGFGFPEGTGAGTGSKQVGLLLDDEEGVREVLATNELDNVIVGELYALLALG